MVLTGKGCVDPSFKLECEARQRSWFNKWDGKCITYEKCPATIGGCETCETNDHGNGPEEVFCSGCQKGFTRVWHKYCVEDKNVWDCDATQDVEGCHKCFKYHDDSSGAAVEKTGCAECQKDWHHSKDGTCKKEDKQTHDWEEEFYSDCENEFVDTCQICRSRKNKNSGEVQ